LLFGTVESEFYHSSLSSPSCYADGFPFLEWSKRRHESICWKTQTQVHPLLDLCIYILNETKLQKAWWDYLSDVKLTKKPVNLKIVLCMSHKIVFTLKECSQNLLRPYECYLSPQKLCL
jgi:hypothetical protein